LVLLSPSQFRDLLSGRRRGVAAAIARLLLGLAEIPYRAAVRWRNHRYDSGRAPVHCATVPVISVGNLTLGGTGKTPFVEWLARWFAERGVRVALISRGYGAKDGAENDEALELRQKLPDVPHLLDPDRVRAARRATNETHCQLILLDDGFQHRRLARDLDIVLVDALEPLGFGHVFPRGTLREPLVAWARAHVVALTRSDMISAAERDSIRQTVESYAPRAAWLQTSFAPRSLRSTRGEECPTNSLAAQRVAAFAGIGNPAGFRHALRSCGYEVVAFREYADHYPYRAADVEALSAWAAGLNVAAVVCTHKDLVKLQIDRLADKPLWALTVGMQIDAGQEELEALLEPLARRAIASG
jgi:tetraacyldisaccharide 4'-kinase